MFIEDSESLSEIHEIEKGKRKKVRRENVHLSREEGNPQQDTPQVFDFHNLSRLAAFTGTKSHI
ncbi:hypothetical protein H5410_024159 [Solanum commersonii]|uniref:Uncharacterized protein n=1 Tax=Solanum commersonii TaxID=4109 RepID=A0A9J5ZL86_SOLCO|nr:hypothetical protein H5410_024159 [Solanum commersonii]